MARPALSSAMCYPFGDVYDNVTLERTVLGYVLYGFYWVVVAVGLASIPASFVGVAYVLWVGFGP